MATLVERAIGAAKLDASIYEEIEHDQGALGQAMAVVVIAAVASGIGAAAGGASAVAASVVGALIGWFVWAFLIWFIGTNLMPEPTTKADIGEVLRTIGFASAPGVLNVFGIVPVIGAIFGLVAAVWQLAAMVVAVRAALDYAANGRAIVVCLIGFVVNVFIVMFLVGILGGASYIANH
ncbi:MAG TPA: YIP1 family protein [Candidatus Binatia bacterium]|nr:YIP1 family protein [Candidatus Binatia bacterium]